MKVLLNKDWQGNERQELDVVVVKENSRTVRVQLPNGDVVVRRKDRDLIK